MAEFKKIRMICCCLGWLKMIRNILENKILLQYIHKNDLSMINRDNLWGIVKIFSLRDINLNNISLKYMINMPWRVVKF